MKANPSGTMVVIFRSKCQKNHFYELMASHKMYALFMNSYSPILLARRQHVSLAVFSPTVGITSSGITITLRKMAVFPISGTSGCEIISSCGLSNASMFAGVAVDKKHLSEGRQLVSCTSLSGWTSYCVATDGSDASPSQAVWIDGI